MALQLGPVIGQVGGASWDEVAQFEELNLDRQEERTLATVAPPPRGFDGGHCPHGVQSWLPRHRNCPVRVTGDQSPCWAELYRRRPRRIYDDQDQSRSRLRLNRFVFHRHHLHDAVPGLTPSASGVGAEA